jgi:hypothetical protein
VYQIGVKLIPELSIRVLKEKMKANFAQSVYTASYTDFRPNCFSYQE